MHMPILMKAEVHGQTQQGYQEVFDALAPLYKTSPGFIAHLSHPIDGGWCVMDVWSSQEQFEKFFRQHVVHRLPANVRPKISFQALHDALSAPGPTAVPSDA
jgi:heme-degrading monooxygenase HmoA